MSHPEPALQAATLALLAERARAFAQRLLRRGMVYEQIAAELAELEHLLAQAKGPGR